MNGMKRIKNWLFTLLFGTSLGFLAERFVFGRSAQEKIISLKAELNAVQRQLRSVERKASAQSAEILTLQSQLDNATQQLTIVQGEADQLRDELSSAQVVSQVTELETDGGVETSEAYVSDDLDVQAAESEGMIILPPESEQVNTPDQLQKIEGVGPKSEAALLGAGVTTFMQIAEMSEGELSAIIAGAGMRRHGSIATWAEQALLAAAGEWDELQALQDELNGGRRVQ